MAIDSRNKRASCIGVCLAAPSVLPGADSTIDSADRLMTAFGYYGILSGNVIVTFTRAVIRAVTQPIMRESTDRGQDGV